MTENKQFNIIIIGGGLLVCVRGMKGSHGTIAPSVIQKMKKEKDFHKCTFVTTSKKSLKQTRLKITNISKIIKFNDLNKFNFYSLDEYTLGEIIKKTQPNLAIVSVPDHLHYKVTKFLLTRNIHCLVVKPFTLKVKEAKKLIELCEKKSLYGAVDFHKRYDTANQLIADDRNKKKIGNLLYAVIEYSQQKSNPLVFFKKWAKLSNVFNYLGVHYVDLIYFITNFRPFSVTCWGQKSLLKKNKIDTYDSMQVIVEWKKPNKAKFVSVHITNWIDSNNSSAVSDQKISIVGDQGRVVSDQKNRGLQIVSEKSFIEDINPYFTQNISYQNNKEFEGYGIKSIAVYIDDIHRLLNGKIKLNDLVKNRPSFQNSLISTWVIEAARKSLNYNNKKIIFNEKDFL